MSYIDMLTEANMAEGMLTEEALSRIAMSITSDKAMAILTASRAGNSPEVDEKRNKELRGLIRSTGFGFRKVKGHYPEVVRDKDGEPVIVNGKEVTQDHIDDSSIILVHKKDEEKLLNFALQMCKRYDQDSILFKHSDGKVVLYDRNKKVVMKLGEFKPNKFSEYMSELSNGRSFEFVVESVSNSMHGDVGGQYGHLALKTRLDHLEKGDEFFVDYEVPDWFLDQE